MIGALDSNFQGPSVLEEGRISGSWSSHQSLVLLEGECGKSSASSVMPRPAGPGKEERQAAPSGQLCPRWVPEAADCELYSPAHSSEQEGSRQNQTIALRILESRMESSEGLKQLHWFPATGRSCRPDCPWVKQGTSALRTVKLSGVKIL